MRLIGNLLVFLGLSVFGGAHALTVDDCQKIKNQKTRLECFDALARVKPIEAPAALVVKEDPLVTAAKRAVEDTLKDPSSIQYRDIRTNSVGDICGEFNAKNSYGGYGGFRGFMYYKSTNTLANNDVAKLESLVAASKQHLDFMTREKIGTFASRQEAVTMNEKAEKAIELVRERIAKCEPKA